MQESITCFKTEISFCLFVINIQGLRAHQVELKAHLKLIQPHIVFIEETWLDASVELITLANYTCISRRDRSEGINRDGIITYSRNDFNHLSHIENSNDDERSWYFLHINLEVLLVANWYRPDASVHDDFAALQSEICNFSAEAAGMVLSGDLNVHHAKYLRHSNGNTIQGSDA